MKFFSYESRFSQLLLKLCYACYLNLLWLVCSLPIFTMGAATTALYYGRRHHGPVLHLPEGHPGRGGIRGRRLLPLLQGELQTGHGALADDARRGSLPRL